MKKLLTIFALFVLSAPAFAQECFISEYSIMPRDLNNNVIPVPREPTVSAPQALNVSTETDSSAFSDVTAYIGIICDVKAHYRFGFGNPTATTSSPFIPANTLRYFAVSSTTVVVSLLIGT